MNKFSKFCLALNKYTDIKPIIYLSPSTGYRARCEFGVNRKSYTMIKNGKKIYLDSSSIPHTSIQKIMPILIRKITESEVMNKKLFQINFRTSGSEIMTSLIYHKHLSKNWEVEATAIQNTFTNVSIIGRSKNQKVLIGKEELSVRFNQNNLNFEILQNDLVFFQPNYYLYPHMIKFIYKRIIKPKDLLELYSGCGGFTLALSNIFKKVFATENNRHAINLLNKSIHLNDLSNIQTARLSDDETALALNNDRPFRRLKNIDLQTYNFSHLLVDPPRAGLSDQTIEISKSFENIIYISCNPITFLRDINKLNREIKSIGLFDQFSNTDHLEIIAILR